MALIIIFLLLMVLFSVTLIIEVMKFAENWYVHKVACSQSFIDLSSPEDAGNIR